MGVIQFVASIGMSADEPSSDCSEVRPCALLLLATAHSLLRRHAQHGKELRLVRRDDVESGGVKDSFPFYHTSDELQCAASQSL